jgi:hypothetical protein
MNAALVGNWQPGTPGPPSDPGDPLHSFSIRDFSRTLLQVAGSQYYPSRLIEHRKTG